jgi:hypothetical protein
MFPHGPAGSDVHFCVPVSCTAILVMQAVRSNSKAILWNILERSALVVIRIHIHRAPSGLCSLCLAGNGSLAYKPIARPLDLAHGAALALLQSKKVADARVMQASRTIAVRASLALSY